MATIKAYRFTGETIDGGEVAPGMRRIGEEASVYAIEVAHEPEQFHHTDLQELMSTLANIAAEEMPGLSFAVDFGHSDDGLVITLHDPTRRGARLTTELLKIPVVAYAEWQQNQRDGVYPKPKKTTH